ncbi:uncharacterized protein LOC122654334 [Telopea speciosissima]|uniref:uncharacterized protein LOC122654334 n=1 Tax=Telopea speciosissima TaxID=54955 RepID=UPI001CC741C4|nr:uncharacterized protein LOC122654334 [Telopea speciosissima]
MTTIKLSGVTNNLLWAQAVQAYIHAKGKIKYITDDPPTVDPKDPTSIIAHDEWMRENSIIKIWLWKSVAPTIASNVMFHTLAKDVWNDLCESFSQEKNISPMYGLYEKLFTFQQGDKSLNEYFATYKGMVEELKLHQPLTTNLDRLKQRAEFHVAKFLARLHPDYQSVKSQILTGEKVPSLNEVFFCINRLANPSKSDSTTKDSSAFTVSRGQGRGRDQSKGRGRGTGGSGTSYQSFDKSTHQCSYCGKQNHTVGTCWAKHGKPEWANELANTAITDNSPTEKPTSDTNQSTISDTSSIVSRDDYNQPVKRLQQLEAVSVSTSTATVAYKGNSIIYPSSTLWLIDSGASCHMTGKLNLCSSINQVRTSSNVILADGSSSKVAGVTELFPQHLP